MLKHDQNIPKAEFELKEQCLYVHNHLNIYNARVFIHAVLKELSDFRKEYLEIDLEKITMLDSVGVAALNYIREQLKSRNIHVHLVNENQSVKKKIEIFSVKGKTVVAEKTKTPFFENIGERAYQIINDYIFDFIKHMADVMYWTISDLFNSKSQRKGEFYNQSVLIGVNAFWIIAAMSFIIGFVLALQSAAQLRNFGANIYIVDLTVIAMMSEMGPLITAILVAGRSGSAIAAEIATMKVTSELDALKTMGLHPVRFVVIPKMHGSIATLPFLTIIADVMGILGGMLIAFISLDISPQVFFNRMTESLYNRDIIIGIFKSLAFAVIIVLTSSFLGLKVKEGAESVGKVTTLSVVASISMVIVADSIIGLFFY